MKKLKKRGSDRAGYASFVSLSCVLTGKTTLEPDLAKAYFERASEQLKTNLRALLTHFNHSVMSGKDPVKVVREEILPHPQDGPSAKLILLLWYIGGIQIPGPFGNDWQMQSADQYYRALVWDAIGAHPPTLSNGYFGHWKYPPEH